MPNSQATIENLLKWQTDQASVDAAVRANQKVESSSKSAALRFGSASEAARALNLSATQMEQLGIATDKTAQSVGYLAQRLEEAARVRSFQGDATGGLRDAAFGGSAGGGNASLVRGLFNARQATIALPGVGYQSPLTIGIRGLEIVAEKTGASVGKLATGLGIVGAAALAVAIAFDRFNQALENSKKSLSAALSANQQYYDAVATLTSEQVDAQIQSLRNSRAALQENADNLRKALDSAFAQAQQTPLGDVGARALFNQLPTGDLKTAFDEADKALQENINLETRLTQGRNAGAFAANDLRAAEEQLADIRRQSADQFVQVAGQQFVDQAHIIARGQQMTKAEREKELASISQNIISTREYRQSLIDTQSTLAEGSDEYKAYQFAIDALRVEIDGLGVEYTLLSRIIRSNADAVDEYAQKQEALKTQTDNYFDALQREGEIRDALTQNQQDVAEVEAKAFNRSAENYADYLERIGDIEADAADRREEIASDAQDRIAEIEADAAIDRSKAIARLDAEALRRANQQETEQKKRVDKQTDKQLDNLEETLDKQERTTQRSYDRQIRNLEDAKNRELYTLQDKYRRLQVDLSNAMYAEQQIALSGAGTQRIIHTQLWQDLNNIAVTWMANTVNTVRSIAQNSGFFSGGGVNGSQVQQIATQAARNYVYDLLVNGRWITAY